MSSQSTRQMGSSRAGLPPGVSLGGLGARVGALLIDLIPITLLVVIMSLARTTVITVICSIVLLGWLGVVWAMSALRAAGPGMRLTKLQLVGLHDGRPVGWGRLLLRAVIFFALAATVVGLLIMIFLLIGQRRHQGWHDRAADAVVIAERPLAPPRQKQSRSSGGELAAAVSDQPEAAQPEPGSRHTVLVEETDQAGDQGDQAGDQSTGDQSADQRSDGLPDGGVHDAPEPAPAPGEPLDQTGPELGGGVVDPDTDDLAQEGEEDEPSADDQPAGQPWQLMLDGSRTITVTHLVLIGRNPQPRSGEEDAELVAVRDQARTVSKTHLAFDVDARGLFVVDRNSTNGSALTDAAGNYRLLAADERTHVSIGDVIAFGEHRLQIQQD